MSIIIPPAGLRYRETGWILKSSYYWRLPERKRTVRYGNLDKLLGIKEAAEILHVHPNTLRRWSAQGKIGAYRMGSRGDRRFRQSDITRFISEFNPSNKTSSPKRRGKTTEPPSRNGATSRPLDQTAETMAEKFEESAPNATVKDNTT